MADKLEASTGSANQVPSFRGPELSEFEHAIVSENQQGEPWAPLSWKDAAVNIGSPFQSFREGAEHFGTSSESAKSNETPT